MGLKLKSNISWPTNKTQLASWIGLISISGVILYGISQFVHAAQVPHVNVVLRVAEDGTAPFDGTTYNPGPPPVNGGTDANATNGVVRVLDYVKYRVEVSVNDTDQTNVTTNVTLDEDQQWTKLPNECLTTTEQPGITPSSSISSDKRTLTCNLGNKNQGTKLVIQPVAQVKGDAINATVADKATCEAVPNTHSLDAIGGCVSAHATAESDDAAQVQGNYTSIITTATFRINLTKTVPINSSTGYYQASVGRQPGPASSGLGNGLVVDWVVRATATKGSEKIKGDANGKRTFILTDTFVDNNPNNDTGAADGTSYANRSSNARLYSWNPNVESCQAISTSIGSISCTQGASDGTGTTDGGSPITITLTDVDVNYPDGPGQVFYFQLRTWVPINSGQTAPNNHDIMSNTDACSAGICGLTLTNSITGLDTPNPSIDGAAPTITSVTNQQNYNGAGEPAADNTFDAPMNSSQTGSSVSIDKAYYGYASGHYGTKTAARGQIVTKGVSLTALKNAEFDKSVICDPLDTSQLTFAGTPQDGQSHDVPNWQAFPTGIYEQHHPTMYTAFPDADVQYIWDANPWIFYSGTPTSSNRFIPGSRLNSNIIRLEYTNVPHGTALNDLRTYQCTDDLDGDSANDWVADYNSLPGGANSVTAVRFVWTDMDWGELEDNYTGPNYSAISGILINASYDVRINNDTTGYNCTGCSPAGNFVVDYTTAFFEVAGITVPFAAPVATADTTNANFALANAFADRIRLVDAKTAITIELADPNQKVISSGEEVTFRVTPYLNGVTGSPVDINLSYIIPNTTLGSPGNMTYVSATQDPSCSTTNGTYGTFNQAGNNITTTISSVDAGQAICSFLVTVRAPVGAPAGNYLTGAQITTSDATINSGSAMPHNGQQPTALASVQILSINGYQVQKINNRSAYEPNETITQELVYSNLGSENYTAGNFIDVLPYNGDNGDFASREDTITPDDSRGSDYTNDDGGVNTSHVGLASLPMGTNGESFSYTTANPSTIPTDPCHSANQTLGFVPPAGTYCYQAYVDNGNQFSDGNSTGTGLINWSFSPPTNLNDVTAIRWSSTPHSAGSPARTVTLSLAPSGNQDGDIYCNNFTGRIPQIALSITSNDICERIVTGVISGIVFSDSDSSGGNFSVNLGEGTYSNIQLRLLNDDGSPYDRDPLASAVQEYITTTNGNGQYQFSNLSSGDYRVEVVNPPTTDQTYDLDDTSPPVSPTFATPHNSGTITLAGPATDPGLEDVSNQAEVDFGYTGTASLAGKVWFDTNQNGQQDSNEDFISGVSIHLLDESGNPVNNPTTNSPWIIQTDTTGDFLFDNIIPGNYRVSFNLPDDIVCTIQNQGVSATDSDGNPNAAGCMTGVVTVLAGDAIINVDLGIIDDPNTDTVAVPGSPDAGVGRIISSNLVLAILALAVLIISYTLYRFKYRRS